MSFNALAKDIAGTLSGVFGDFYTFERQNEHRSQIPAVIRRDVETVDDDGQVAVIDYVVRLAVQDVPFTPRRGDILCNSSVTYTIGRRLTDNGFSMEFEATT